MLRRIFCEFTPHCEAAEEAASAAEASRCPWNQQTNPNPATLAPSSVPKRSARRAQTMFSGPPSTASFVERELMDPHNIMESGATLNGLRDQSLDTTLDFLKQPVDMGVRPPAPRGPLPRLVCAKATRLTGLFCVARHPSWRLSTMVV